jgi:hypothetical protein
MRKKKKKKKKTLKHVILLRKLACCLFTVQIVLVNHLFIWVVVKMGQTPPLALAHGATPKVPLNKAA